MMQNKKTWTYNDLSCIRRTNPTCRQRWPGQSKVERVEYRAIKAKQACESFLEGRTGDKQQAEPPEEAMWAGKAGWDGWADNARSTGRVSRIDTRSCQGQRSRRDRPGWTKRQSQAILPGQTMARWTGRGCGGSRATRRQERTTIPSQAWTGSGRPNFWNSAQISFFENEDKSEHSRFLFLLGPPETETADETNSLADTTGEDIV